MSPLAAAVALGACQTAGPPLSVSPAPSPASIRSALAACPLGPAPAGPQTILSGQRSPDDLAIDAQGRLIFSDINAGAIIRLSASGVPERLALGLRAPEGVVVRPDGRLLVVEQDLNRIVLVDPDTHAISPWRVFPNRTGKSGIDGIAADPRTGEVIVPDSPNGVVWRVSPDGAQARLIWSGLIRPAGAAVAPDGAVLIADEGGPVVRISEDPPQARQIVRLPVPDDVVVDREEVILVNTLGDGAIHEIAPGGGHRVLLSGLRGPQGIALDSADNLYFTESGAGRIGRLVRTFALDVASVTPSPNGTFVICPSVLRAAGFRAQLEVGLAPTAEGTAIMVRSVPSTPDSSGLLEVRLTAGADRRYIDIVVRSGSRTLTQRVELLKGT